MRNKQIFFAGAIAVVIVLSGIASQDKFPILKGPYLGQDPPGMKPEIFAPGVISTELFGESGLAFTGNGKLLLYNRRPPSEEHKSIYLTELKEGKWTNPAPAPFNSEYPDWDFHFAPDSRTFFFTSKRPVNQDSIPSRYANIWVTELSNSGWTKPHKLEYPVNTSDNHDCGGTQTIDGTLYFFSRRKGGFGESDIYRARLVNGKYSQVENLGKGINSEHGDYDAFIAPDESYLIFSSDRPGGFGEYNDMYIAFKKMDGTWTVPQNLGRDFRDSGISQVTLDGRFLFFGTGRTGHDDIYWVDARIIEELRPDPLK